MAVRSIEAPSQTLATDLVPAHEPSPVLASPSFRGARGSSVADQFAGPSTASVVSVAPLPRTVASAVAPASASTSYAGTSDLPAAVQYRAAGTLDPGPKPLGDIAPDYPARAGQQQGLVVLRLLINEQGGVDNVAVVRATPAGYFEESALEAFGKALFSPGKLLGVSVKSQITIEVEFMPINRGATVSGRTY